MKTLARWLSFSIAIGLGLGTMGSTLAETIQLSPGFPGPKTATGTSGGTIDAGNCGYISNTPNHQLVLSADFDYLRVAASGGEGLTLLVRGPGGEFCAPRDPQQSGYWQQGTYEIFVGDGTGMGNPYTLSISATPQP
jgi:hypothetical protein